MLKISGVICKSSIHSEQYGDLQKWERGGIHTQSRMGDGVDFTEVTILRGRQGWTFPEKTNQFSIHAVRPAGVSPVTFMAHFMTSAVSSHTTRSTHLRLGSFSLRICFLTIASKARSGVNSPVLSGRGGQDCVLLRQSREEGQEEIKSRTEKEGKKREEEEIKEKSLVQLVNSCYSQENQAVEEDKLQVFHILFTEEADPPKIGQYYKDDIQHHIQLKP